MSTLPPFSGDGDDEDSLSLSDLPLIHQSPKNSPPHTPQILSTHDFHFCANQHSQMCAADDVFFQGQILPFRHSKISLTRSESMDYPSSAAAGVFTSRSSSLSSSSTTSSAAAGTLKKLPINLFHSHPSPSPKLQSSAARRNCTKKSSSPWNIFRLGLLTNPPKIAFNDFKSRGHCNNFGSRNSNSSNSSSNSDQRRKGGSNLLGGCNCSMDAVDTVSRRNSKPGGIMKRSMSHGNKAAALMKVEEQTLLPATTKKRVSNTRTFEWLKQLSIDGGGCATEEL